MEAKTQTDYELGYKRGIETAEELYGNGQYYKLLTATREPPHSEYQRGFATALGDFYVWALEFCESEGILPAPSKPREGGV